ncbi:hereditary hemochromatosis protein homolog isoform X2 [Megalobrama amblycephala]|uniref:hereditary hemochromatosis protein homolog isoform X2 n=1 Tax=Megalobrama amblycephala TaxID=75352 RepID=UPI002013E82C|nr:hereditary hemochromatosis protein homolog isoform X2 [Megalobrama amblycephala]
MDNIFHLFLLSLPIAAPKGSHSLWVLATYIKGQTQFPEFSYVVMLDDVRVLYYNGETKTLIPRGNTTTEEEVFNPNVLLTISDNIQSSFMEKWVVATNNINKTYSVLALQRLVVCELRDDGEPGQMITRDAVRGSTTDELLYVDKNFTYQGNLNVSTQVLNLHLKISMWNHEHLYQPFCIKTLKGYLEKRRNQVNIKVKPRVRLLKTELSSGSRVSCLATGFYPRHINLTLFRDGQPVSDHEITGGDLLPNGDGTYQMRKSLEISADKHKYTCSATHLSLDNKLDVTLEYDHGEPFNLVIPSVLMVLALMLVIAAITSWKRQCAGKLTETVYNKTEGPVVLQILRQCEVLDNDKPGQMITKFAFEGSTTEEMRFIDDTFTYQSIEKQSTIYLEMHKWRYVNIGYPLCTTNLRNYLKKRGTQGKRRGKPRVRLIQKANSDSGGFRVSCLATGFYPRHINLTLFRDGQPVSDHEITGGDLLPNGDGTYQMRKSLEISADKHKYTCSATHLSLDNKLDVTLASYTCDYSSTSSTEDNVDKT